MTTNEIKHFIGRWLFYVLKHLIHRLVKRFNIRLPVLQALIQQVYEREILEHKDITKEIK